MKVILSLYSCSRQYYHSNQNGMFMSVVLSPDFLHLTYNTVDLEKCNNLSCYSKSLVFSLSLANIKPTANTWYNLIHAQPKIVVAMIKRLHPLLYSIITLSVAKTHSQNDMTAFTLILSMRCLKSWWKNYHLFTKLLEDFWVEATVVIKFTKNTILCKK